MDDKAKARASSDGPIVDLARKLIISMGEDHYCIDDAQGCVYSPGGCRCVSKLAAALAAARQEEREAQWRPIDTIDAEVDRHETVLVGWEHPPNDWQLTTPYRVSMMFARKPTHWMRPPAIRSRATPTQEPSDA